DYDGKYSYSSVKRVEVDQVYQLKAFPNPTKGKFTFTTGFELEEGNVKLINLLGQGIPITVEQDGLYYMVSPASPPPGVYILQVKKGFWAQSIRVILEQ
ncbi:MAG TPA: T9SS type A sorting domain-containing protein, partial [Flavobacteriales bacterium]|nr:T9SS type A sorting domain-containing protein [Flavobacteriales bacterium]